LLVGKLIGKRIDISPVIVVVCGIAIDYWKQAGFALVDIDLCIVGIKPRSFNFEVVLNGKIDTFLKSPDFLGFCLKEYQQDEGKEYEEFFQVIRISCKIAKSGNDLR